MRKEFYVPMAVLAFLSGCAPDTYVDITGQGRGQAQFNMDQAYCNIVKQSVPLEAVSGSCDANCALIVLGTNAIILQNAFANCLESRGWQQSS